MLLAGRFTESRNSRSALKDKHRDIFLFLKRGQVIAGNTLPCFKKLANRKFFFPSSCID